MANLPQTNLEWAIFYADECLWDIFPIWWIKSDGNCACGLPLSDDGCTNPGKHPIGPLVKTGHRAATSDIKRITAWWTQYPEANIGFATGEKSGVVVIDADGETGLRNLASLDYPETVSAISGSKTGKHLFYAHPGFTVNNGSRNNKPDVLGSIDFRGDGGYIILPPSTHISGGQYAWENMPMGGIDIKPLPEHFLKGWFGVDKNGEKSKGIRDKDDDRDAGFDPDVDDSDTEYVEEGRNLFLTHKAGILRRGGLNEEEILTGLRGINSRQCKPPLPDSEMVRIAHNIAPKPTGDTGPKIVDTSNYGGMDQRAASDPEIQQTLINANQSDTGNAECFVALYPDSFRWVTNKGRGVWYNWAGSKWEEDSGAIARRAMVVSIRKRAEAANGIPKKAVRSALLRHCNTSENFGKLTSALSMVQNFEGITTDVNQFDQDEFMLGMPSMVMDMRTGNTRPANPQDMLSRNIAVDFDEKATCPLWEKFVLQIMGGDAERAAYLQRVIGHMLTGEMLEQKFFIFHGYGANGKSTFLSVIRDLFKDYGETVPFDSFDSDSQNGVGNDMARLQSVRFVACIESEHSKKLAESRIKSITGGDPMTCRYLYGEFFTYTPQFKIIMAVNHLPLIYGGGDGMWRRISLIPFEQKFDGDNNNKNLRAELLGELPGILNWCITGYRKWKDMGGLGEPGIVLEAVEEYRVESDQVERFLEEAVEYKEDRPSHQCTKAAMVYQAYRQWTMENGERTMGNNIFVKKMKEKGYERHKLKGKDGHIFPGIEVMMKVSTLIGGFNEDL